MKLCSVEGCSHAAVARGWCNTHYARWSRNGSPTASRRHIARLMAMIESASDDCVIWDGPIDSRGYAHITVNYKTVTVHSVACEYGNGARPNGLVAAHNCNTPLCVNPRHLRWATQAENIADQERHGTRIWGERHYKAVLTDAQVLEAMRLIKAGQSVSAVARHFGVSRGAIRQRVETLGSRFEKGGVFVKVEIIPREAL